MKLIELRSGKYCYFI